MLDNRIVKDYILFIPFCYLRN